MPDGGPSHAGRFGSISDGILQWISFLEISRDLLLALQGKYPGRGTTHPGRGKLRFWAFLQLFSSFLLGFFLGFFLGLSRLV